MVCGVVATALGVVAFTGWSVGNLVMAGAYDDKIPMAPNTAIKFILFGTCLAVWAWRPFDRSVIWLSRIVAVLIATFSLFTLIQFLTTADWGIDTFLFQSAQRVSQIKVGYTSSMTAIAFLAAAASFLAMLLSDDGKNLQKNITSLLSAAVALLGLVVTIGYLYGSPLLYGGTVVPMASTTAIAFISLSTGLILATGKDIWLVHLFSGDSLRSRLMRVFLPLTLIAVIFEGWVIVTIVYGYPEMNLAATSSLSAVFLVLLVGLVIFQVSRNIGASVDNAIEQSKRAAESLRESEERFRSVAQSANEAIVTIDEQGRIMYWNLAAIHLFGYKEDEA